MKPLFLMKAHNYDPKKFQIAGCYGSEKLDGFRCFWDGGLTTGLPASEVPWANTDKDARFHSEPIATGLWTFYGHPYCAPDWFINALPRVALDGELWAGRGNWQGCARIVKSMKPDSVDWRKVQFRVFDAPPLETVLGDRYVNITAGPSKVMYRKYFRSFYTWALNRLREIDRSVVWSKATWPFESRLNFLNTLSYNSAVDLHEPYRLPMTGKEAKELLELKLKLVFDRGGEGVVLRRANSLWQPWRSWDLAKIKASNDMEGTVIGYVAANEGKILGLMGSLILLLDNGKELKLSGFTDEERAWASFTQFDWSVAHVGERVPDWFTHLLFPIGKRVTFTYMDLGEDGVPHVARYLRPREDD